ncbi:MAG: NAD(P)H-dependent oxidoreductase [Steroidobacteraceae bacterium]|nr:NAD(P)H-dependent oxidoreductase [Steroidobacteraceae bacterium]
MTRILGISGSLRRGSFNASLLRAAVEVAPAGLTVDVGTIRGIPLYDADVEAQGMPPAVVQLKEQLQAADGLLLVTPEYNNSIPGVFKNAIDWLSRPPVDVPRLFREKPVALMGASPGRFGTLLSQTAWLTVIRTLGMRPFYGASLYVSEAAKVFDASGTLIDPDVRERLKNFMNGFAQFVTASAR